MTQLTEEQLEQHLENYEGMLTENKLTHEVPAQIDNLEDWL